jgi:hypothetical protein
MDSDIAVILRPELFANPVSMVVFNSMRMLAGHAQTAFQKGFPDLVSGMEQPRRVTRTKQGLARICYKTL